MVETLDVAGVYWVILTSSAGISLRFDVAIISMVRLAKTELQGFIQ